MHVHRAAQIVERCLQPGCPEAKSLLSTLVRFTETEHALDVATDPENARTEHEATVERLWTLMGEALEVHPSVRESGIIVPVKAYLPPPVRPILVETPTTFEPTPVKQGATTIVKGLFGDVPVPVKRVKRKGK